MDAWLSWLICGRSRKSSYALLAPAVLWLALFLIIPVACLLELGFLRLGPYGTVVFSLTLSNFSRAIEPRYLEILLRTLGYAGITTLLCLALGFPAAYYLSFRAGRRRELCLAALMIPFWTSCLVALYSWMIILGREGLLNSLLLRSGLIAHPLRLLNTPFSVVLGLAYFYIPFMVLPLYGSLEKLPRQYLEASYDLGAGRARTFFKVTLPLCLPGVVAGCILTFIPCMGDFLTAEFLGGPRTYLVGNLIQNQFLMAQDWPFGAALTSVLLILLVAGLYFYQRVEPQR
ncbi:MAG: ABC transporter permease [Elusimicrobia bacterium]|nr:ABC transporter permease [Elusimicrobiota bacterium]MDE2425464.1 ABC transporter permease [Elusimicrobiota bacterium]